MSWQVRVQMVGYTRAAVSCTFSTTGFQNSRNEVQALLAEAFGNSSVWSQHVTNGIINVLYSITPSWHFGTKEEELHSAGSGHGLGFPLRNVYIIQKPQRRKSHAHRDYLVNVIWRPPTQKQTWPMEFSYWQLLLFSHSSVQVSFWRCSLWNDMNDNGYAVVPGACRVPVPTKAAGTSPMACAVSGLTKSSTWTWLG